MSEHITVLQTEAISALNIQPASVIVDATFGGGGHSRVIASQLGVGGTLIGIDVDETAIAEAGEMFKETKATTHFLTGNFASLDQHLSQLGIATVDGIIADLGWRTEQFEASGKGFSFSSHEPLLMTLGDPEQYLFTAHDVVNSWAEEDIANVIYAYGEERSSRRIAKAIVNAREKQPINTAHELATIVAAALPRAAANRRIHPATKTFQALRIVVNDELKHLEQFLAVSLSCLNTGGRLAIITFHSLEDRMVKHTFRTYAHDHLAIPITKKPIIPSPEEQQQNRRARSAKLRVIEKI